MDTTHTRASLIELLARNSRELLNSDEAAAEILWQAALSLGRLSRPVAKENQAQRQFRRFLDTLKLGEQAA